MAQSAAAAIPTESAVRDRAIERSTRAARERAAQRVQHFLDAARSVIDEKGTTEFTVQEIVDRSKQSLRSFYQYFDGKHELLLALFEEEMGITIGRLVGKAVDGDPLDRLEHAIGEIFEMSRPARMSGQPVFGEFALRLLVDHPEEVAASYAPLISYLTEIVQDGLDAGLLRPGKARRVAAIVLQTATFASATGATGGRQPVTKAEVWQFCFHAVATDEVVAARGR